MLEEKIGRDLHMSALTGKPLKGLQSLAPMFHVKRKFCINNSGDDFCVIGREENWFLLSRKEIIFINQFKPSLNTKEDNTKLVLIKQ